MAEKKISDYLPKTEILAQLAEEASEFAQAALKLRRALDGKNPTPKSIEECEANLREEWADVQVAFDELWHDKSPSEIWAFDMECQSTITKKLDRWLSRLQENPPKLEKECDDGDFDVKIHCENEQEMDEAVALLNLANRMHWRKTAECPPTEKDAVYGNVLVNYKNTTFTQSATWDIVAGAPETFPLWMPMPKLPEEKHS